ncbi:AAA family ATPase [Planomonospora parontospora]|uniref:AAA family ATPase n=1 Tax=Planomonospora parontospora TaxID=58119 RepID=UPI00166FA939|nr:AAA family ATPase [Planomonospora parontospora]GGL58863.1 ABC transporter, ATP-binding protein [Planomonospora parontospora subsp. antibiotica]GII20235.1 ABC transporter, ATP-binding protein [Planomonospora parontospora subsp. antibiotica]
MLITRLAIPDHPSGEWPFTLPAVRALSDGITLTAPVTFLVGENGSGKSTIIEAIADACGVNSEGGKAGTRYASTGPATALGEILDVDFTVAGLRLTRGPRLKRRVFFLRAETLVNLGRAVSGLPGYWERHLDEQSHGEGFLTVLERMVTGPGIYLMDEPEAALSFHSCLRLVGLMDQVVREGGQIICATHSPILTGLPGAHILELGDDGIHATEWDKLQVVDHWRRFLVKPDFYLRYVLGESPGA